MKITVNKTNIGTEVKIFVPSTEINPITQSVLLSKQKNGVRITKNFKKSLSQKQREATERVIECIIDDYNSYEQLYTYSGSKFVIEKLHGELEKELDTYQLNSLGLICEIALATLFNTKIPYSVETLRKRYSLDSDKDILVSVVGTFGYGKTTLIKKLLGFDDNYNFLLVDNGRTTIYNYIVRALIVTKYSNGNEYIWYRNENDENELILLEDYRFKNYICLHSIEYLYNTTISQSLGNAFKLYCKNPSNIDGILRKFIENSKCSLDGLFGDIKADISGLFYSQMLNEFENIYKDYEDALEDINYDFTKNDTLYKEFSDYYKKSISKALSAVKDKTEKEIIYEENKPIYFELSCEEINDGKTLEACYFPFTNNITKGTGLRILVSEIYTELDFDATQFVNDKGENVFPEQLYLDLDGRKTSEYHSIVFADTVGCSHLQTSSDTSLPISSNSMQDIIANSALLNESDLIILLENATKSMSEDIKGQLLALENLGCKNKVIMCYSFYNQFVKKDITSDEIRENILDMLLRNALESLYPENLDKASRIYKIYTDKAQKEEVLYEKNRHIVYLKGLVKRQDIESTSTKGRRRALVDNGDISVFDENALAHKLNKDFEDCDSCLQELLNKMLIAIDNIRENKNKVFSITDKSKESDFILGFADNLYNKFRDDYIASQCHLYKEIVPEWNTSGALCNNAANGDASFRGTSLSLAPLTDSLTHISTKTSNFFENNSPIEINVDEEGETIDKALDTDFLIDQIKAKFSSNLENSYKLFLVTGNKKRWNELRLDGGTGVKVRRANGIFKLIRDVYSMDSVKSKTLEILQDSVKEIIREYETN